MTEHHFSPHVSLTIREDGSATLRFDWNGSWVMAYDEEGNEVPEEGDGPPLMDALLLDQPILKGTRHISPHVARLLLDRAKEA